MPTRRTTAAALLSGAVLLSASLAACGPAGEGGAGGGGGEEDDRGRIWAQSLNWKDCPAPSPLQGGGEAPEPLPDGTRWQCATMRAPLDWDRPGGETVDVATPYEGAARMAERLGKGVGMELTYEGEGHGAYDSGNTCVRKAVNAYLLDGTVPAAGTVCEREPLQGKG